MVRTGLAIAAVVTVIDQVGKSAMVYYVMDPPRIIPVTGFLDLVMVWNRGVSFGLFSNESAVMPWILASLSLAIVVWLVLWLRSAADRFMAVALGLVIGGAIGNMIDRLHWGAVADMFSVTLSFIPLALFNPWPSFNGADIFIFIGVFMILYDGFFRAQDGNKK